MTKFTKSFSIKPVLSNHMSYVTIFHCSLGRSYKTGLTVQHYVIKFLSDLWQVSCFLQVPCRFDTVSTITWTHQKDGLFNKFWKGTIKVPTIPSLVYQIMLCGLALKTCKLNFFLAFFNFDILTFHNICM
jgi:hypothetical protein